jgi:hypothetical protein
MRKRHMLLVDCVSGEKEEGGSTSVRTNREELFCAHEARDRIHIKQEDIHLFHTQSYTQEPNPEHTTLDPVGSHHD